MCTPGTSCSAPPAQGPAEWGVGWGAAPQTGVNQNAGSPRSGGLSPPRSAPARARLLVYRGVSPPVRLAAAAAACQWETTRHGDTALGLTLVDRLSAGDLLLRTSYHWPGLPWKSNLCDHKRGSGRVCVGGGWGWGSRPAQPPTLPPASRPSLPLCVSTCPCLPMNVCSPLPTCCRQSLGSGGHPSPGPSWPAAAAGCDRSLSAAGRTQPPRSS